MPLVSGRFSAFWTLLVLPLVLMFPNPLSGQVVSGMIRDSSTGDVLSGVRVTLLDLSGDTVATSASGADGSFVVSAPRWGRYILSSIRLGYSPVTVADLKLLTGDTLQLAFWMGALATAMDPIVVEAEAAVQYADAQYLHREGFYRRARATTGRHLDPITIEQRRPTAQFIADYLSHLPGVQPSPRGLRLRCGQPNFFIDDIPAQGYTRIEDVVLPIDVLAIEVYDGSSVGPAHYGGHCSILVWTRHKAEFLGSR